MRRYFISLAAAFLIAAALYAGPAREREQALPIAAGTVYASSDKVSEKKERTISEILYSLGNLYAYLSKNYIYEIDNSVMQNDLISAMVDGLGDKYSYYILPEDADQFKENTDGRYVGIGTYLTKMNPSLIDYSDPETYMIIITSPFPGGPADRAGIKARDMISHVNGEDISELNATEASKLVRGEKGVPITLTIHRASAVFDITLTPEEVITPTSMGGMIGDDVGYVMIYQFSKSTAESFRSEVQKLLDKGAKKLIIDVRNNGGGIVESSLAIADMFVDSGNLLSIKYKPGSDFKDVVYKASGNDFFGSEIPLAVLVNGGTASASEILTAALKENGRSTIVGNQTFGKGIMQQVLPFMDGYLNFTVAHYYTPDGNDIHEVGIHPDVVVEEPEYTDQEMEAYADFLKIENMAEFREAHPEYTKENIDLFADEYKDSGVPEDLLRLLMRNEYIYSLDWEDRPIADPEHDEILQKALEILR